MNKKIVIIVTAIIIAILTVILLLKNSKTEDFRTEIVEKKTIIQVVEASGTIQPVQTVSIGSQVSGMIKEIYVDFNSNVKKGQLLAQIDTSLFSAQVEQAQANISNARSNLAKIQAIAENDKKTYTRYQNLYKRNFVAKSELDLAEATYKSDMAQIAAARAQIAQAGAAYNTAASNLRYTKIISPVDGVVVSRGVDVGQTVAASFQTPELFSVAQDLTKMQIETNVAEADIGKVKVGQEVEYTLDGYPDSIFNGKVLQVRISPTTLQNVVTYTVIVQVKNEDMKLIPGMSANVSIITGKTSDAKSVPNEALKFTPNTDGNAPKYKEQGVWILAENKKPKRINIKTGASDDSYTEIISKDINLGDSVIVDLDGKNSKGQNGVKGNKATKGTKPPMRMF